MDSRYLLDTMEQHRRFFELGLGFGGVEQANGHAVQTYLRRCGAKSSHGMHVCMYAVLNKCANFM